MGDEEEGGGREGKGGRGSSCASSKCHLPPLSSVGCMSNQERRGVLVRNIASQEVFCNVTDALLVQLRPKHTHTHTHGKLIYA